MIGGWITDTLNWHWLFYINLVPGVAITILVPLLVKIDKPDLSLLKGADYAGIGLMAAALGTLEYMLEEGSRWNWFDDRTIRECAVISGATGILFVIRSLTFARPVVDLRALLNRNFALGCILSFVTGIAIFATIYLTPLSRPRCWFPLCGTSRLRQPRPKARTEISSSQSPRKHCRENVFVRYGDPIA